MGLFFNYDNSVCNEGATPVFFSYDPSITSLKELLIYELSQMSYYSVKLKEIGIDTEKINDRIINYISLAVVNLDFRKEQFLSVIKNIYDSVKELEEEYKTECVKREIEPLIIQGEKLSFETKKEGFAAINFGERQSILKNTVFSKDKKKLSDIVMMMVSSACLCVTEIENYGKYLNEIKDEIPYVLYLINYSELSDNELKQKVIDFSKINLQIMKELNSVILEKYGPVESVEVDLSIKKGKCILVSGHYYRNLEMLLELLKDEDINVYTHNDMLFAHCYSNLNKYKNLVGHYQRSLNNLELDFATFPGAVLITKNSHTNLDTIRGRIFTPDNNPAYGICKVSENDFTPLINAAKEEKGFKKNVNIGKLSVGYDRNLVFDKLQTVIDSFNKGRYEHLFFIGLTNYNSVQNIYFKKFFETINDNCYVISFSYSRIQKNIWHIDLYYDMSLIYDILDKLQKYPKILENTTFFLTQCHLRTVSHALNLKLYNVKNIFLGECCPTIISPTLIDGLKDLFGIKQISKSPQDDIETILNNNF